MKNSKVLFSSVLFLTCLVLGIVWWNLNRRERWLHQQISYLKSTYKPLKQIQEQYSSVVFPWNDYRSFESTQQVVKTILHDHLYQPNVTFSKPTHSPSRTHVRVMTGTADGWILPTQCEPFLEALAQLEAPLWIQRIELKRHGHRNAALNLRLTFLAMAFSETNTADATAAP
ncbi:MAG: hypothetical protein J6Z25_01320 [Opitutales bacterium]|nr:hypothetical protein [Opitutales bacterium]